MHRFFECLLALLQAFEHTEFGREVVDLHHLGAIAGIVVEYLPLVGVDEALLLRVCRPCGEVREALRHLCEQALLDRFAQFLLDGVDARIQREQQLAVAERIDVRMRHIRIGDEPLTRDARCLHQLGNRGAEAVRWRAVRQTERKREHAHEARGETVRIVDEHAVDGLLRLM